jgi:hypothetical protein
LWFKVKTVSRFKFDDYDCSHVEQLVFRKTSQWLIILFMFDRNP